MDQLNLNAWVGRAIEDGGRVTDSLAAQIHATLGAKDDAAPAAGDLLPGLWHWCAFPPLTPLRDLGADGHPGPGALLPPVRLIRRMWAGGSLTFHAPLHVGDALRRRSMVSRIEEKTGATGPMVLMHVDHQIFGPAGLAIEERQTLVYLDIPAAFTPPKKRPMLAEASAIHPMPETLLFRYSAITFNAHRIHYDHAYATEVEKYPGLVVHGPLQASLLMAHAVRTRRGLPRFFEFTGVHPMFAGTDLEICHTESDEEPGEMTLCTGQNGHQGMIARAIWDGVL